MATFTFKTPQKLVDLGMDPEVKVVICCMAHAMRMCDNATTRKLGKGWYQKLSLAERAALDEEASAMCVEADASATGFRTDELINPIEVLFGTLGFNVMRVIGAPEELEEIKRHQAEAEFEGDGEEETHLRHGLVQFNDAPSPLPKDFGKRLDQMFGNTRPRMDS